MAKTTKLLALDASTTNIGYAVMVDGKITKADVYRPRGGVQARLRLTARWLHMLMVSHGDFTHLAIEEAMGNHKNRQTDRKLSRVIGACLAIAALHDAHWLLIHPSTIKATGCHKHALRIAEATAGLEHGSLDRPGGEDIADAIGCALAAWTEIRQLKLEELT